MLLVGHGVRLLWSLVIVAIAMGLSLRTYIVVELLIEVASGVRGHHVSLQRVESATVEFVTVILELRQSSIGYEVSGVHRSNLVHFGETSDSVGSLTFTFSLAKLMRLGISGVRVTIRVLEFL